MKKEYDTFQRTRDAIDLCIKTGTWMELNLSGLRYSVGRPFPPYEMIQDNLGRELKIFIGSDSHKVETFKDFIPEIKNANEFIRKKS